MSISTNTTKLQISEIDFDTIKLALQTFLAGQAEFSDYNFEGSGLSVILNILAFNTHYLAYYLNMIANEMFLDSAARRENIISLAKEIGYIPGSKKSAQAVINVKVIPSGPGSPPTNITIDKGTKFNSTVNNINFVFVTTQAITLTYDSGNNWYLGTNINVFEGIPYTYKWNYSSSSPTLFIIPNDGVDTSTVVVRVQQNSGNSATTTYSLAQNINLLTGTSNVYFLQEITGGLYEVYFGDGILGNAIADGNIVFIDYLNCNGDQANFCNVFTAAQPIGSYGNVTVTTVTPAFGGSDREDIESVRFSAPLNYQAQDRAVTVGDYKAIITKLYPNVDSVAVWGGEDMVPPQYGKVFLSLQPVSGYVITQFTKQTVVNEILSTSNIVSIIPTIIDPEYIFLTTNSIVKFDAQSTSLTADAIKTLVINTIQNFAVTDIGKFDRVFRYSKLTRVIDNSDPSITNNLTTIQIQKRFTPTLNSVDQYVLSYNNSLVPGTITSTAFVDTLDPSFISGDKYFFDDDGQGNIRTYKFVGTQRKYTKLTSGVIDYTNGIVTLNSFKPSDVIDTSKELRVTANPLVNDVIPVRNNIIIIENADITVNMVANGPILV